MTSQSMNFMFTINNPKDCDEPPNVWPHVRWVVWQHERGAEGTDHIQGYVCFDKKMTFKQAHELLPEGAWIQKRQGTHAQAKAYCTKTESRIDGPWVHGDEPAQGHRSDLDAAAALARSSGMHAVALAHPSAYIRYHKGLQSFRTITTVARNWLTDLIIYWGKPGTGKSWHCRDLWPDAFWLKKGRSGEPWWDGYDGQETIIIDEFYGWISVDTMSRMVDQYPYSVEVKGASVPFTARRIVITSNDPPTHWWTCELHGMRRRLDAAYIYRIDTPLYDTPPYPPEIDHPPLEYPYDIILEENGARLRSYRPISSQAVPVQSHRGTKRKH